MYCSGREFGCAAVLRIQSLLTFHFHTDPDPAFQSDTDPDPTVWY
jgi:hypothetical protein